MPRLLITLTVVCALAPLGAQTPCYAENDGAGFNDLVSMGGPLLLGIKFTIPLNIQANQLEIFTGEATGTNTLGIWTHSAAMDTPGVDLGTGSWSMTSGNSWQGAALPAAITLASGGTYWLVWGTISGSQASVDVPMASLGQPYRASFDAGQSWNGGATPFQFPDRHWKFRIYGSCGGPVGCQAIEITDVTGVLPAPTLLPPTGTITALLSLTPTQSATAQIRLRVASDQPLQPYLIAAGLVILPAPVSAAPLGGFVALDVVDPGFVIGLDGFSNPGLATTDAQGVGEIPFSFGTALPSGLDLYIQGIVICASGGLTLTDTAQISIL